MSIEATPGSSSADSYCTVVEADDYFATSFGRTLWAASNTGNKEILLKESTRLLDALVKWNGFKSTSNQSLRWPRSFVQDPDAAYGYVEFHDSGVGLAYIDNSIIPKQIKEATCELAYSILANSGFSDTENDLTIVKVGPISLNFSDKVKTQGFPQIVRSMISLFGSYSVGSSNEVRTVSVERV